MDSSTIGYWEEIWFVGGSQASPTLEFTVVSDSGCQLSSSPGPGYVATMQSQDYYALNVLDYVFTNSPLTVSQSVTSGRCQFSSLNYSQSSSIAVTSQPSPNGKSVNWTLKDFVADPPHTTIPYYRDNQGNCPWCYGWWYIGTYEFGEVTAVFTNPNTQEQFQITSNYQLLIYGENY